jgi:hypothetical protein
MVLTTFSKTKKMNNSLERSLMVPQGAEVVKIQKNRPDSNSIQSILKKNQTDSIEIKQNQLKPNFM